MRSTLRVVAAKPAGPPFPAELCRPLVKERCERDGLGCDDEVVARQFRLHLHRGISYLATPGSVRSIADLIRLAASLHRRQAEAVPRHGPGGYAAKFHEVLRGDVQRFGTAVQFKDRASCDRM